MKIFEKLYDAAFTKDLLEAYFDTGRDSDVLNELINQFAPLVSMVAHIELEPTDDYDLVKVDTLSKLYEKLRETRFNYYPLDNERVFTSFCYKIIHRMVVDTLRALRVQTFHPWKKGMDIVYSDITYPDAADAERFLYVSQIKALTLQLFKQEIRFNGKERQACILMAESLLGLRKEDPSLARHRFHMTSVRTAYLVKYTRMLLKQISYFIKEIDESIGS